MAAVWCATEGFRTDQLHQDDTSIDVPDEQIKKLGKEPKQVQDGEWKSALRHYSQCPAADGKALQWL
jgi:hypothetical protein